MRKLYLVFILFILSFHFGFSQEVELGVKAGMNASTLGKSDLGLVPRIGYHIGGTAEFITTPFFSIQTELTYSLQGAAQDRSRQVYLNYHYLNIPLLLKAYFHENASFEFGAQYGLLLKAVQKNEFNNQNPSEDVKNSDFAIIFGLAYKLNEQFNFGLRFNLGISNTANRDIVYELRHTNRVLQISFGYIFGKK